MPIAPTPAERAQERLSPAHLEEATQAIHRDGYVIIKNAVPADPLDRLAPKMDDDSQRLVEAHKRDGSKRPLGHLQQGPPLHAPYIFREIVANAFAIQITHAILGDGLFCSFYNGNTNAPGSIEQHLHRDARLLWPEWDKSHPSTTLVINVPVTDTDESNGSTEIWPGTHVLPGELTEACIEARRAQVPPVRANTTKGDIFIRDIRLWHRGVPNPSDRFRHMIAMVHHMAWYRRHGRLKYQKGCEDAFADCPLDHNAEFVDTCPDYLFGPLLPHS
jgi:hypothetical protein